ncbi:hypothetical protein MNBD_NITROSPINAE01-1253 [hydrothermal vent metagenome]|uniref:Kef-type K+ transport systems (NAD-binding component fused to domain related to exopolyphosphatase) n=1 Tax=hydrothermal vent metagenome TaxID=652676 RepID=A0A3B1BNX2_9ZZZZ
MRYFVFIDRPDITPVIYGLLKDQDEMLVVKIGEEGKKPGLLCSGKAVEWTGLRLDELEKLNITVIDKVIVSVANDNLCCELVETLSTAKQKPSIIILREGQPASHVCKNENVSIIDITEIARKRLSSEWKTIATRQKANRLVETIKDAGKVLIMTQNDPDPDAIASGMALQTLLGRDHNTAPICTFGEITRNENLAMSLLLDVDVTTITPDDLPEFDKVVMVDTQPPYFAKEVFQHVDAVIDHHPHLQNYEAAFRDVNTSYGATATMMYEYLTATETKISIRLATALLYGVLTDTMFLARETSKRDFEAFSGLWPSADMDLLGNMSRPRLSPKELSYFVRAIQDRMVHENLVIMWLGSIMKEDIIPRLADFSLQIGESTVSAVCGNCHGDLIISARSITPYVHAGEMMRSLFSKIGSAGGHHSMAKAVIPLKSFMETFGVEREDQVQAAIFEIFKRATPHKSL